MAEKRRTVVKTFRMTEDEAEVCSRMAEEREISESELLRFLLKQKPKDYPEIRTQLRDLITEMNRIGTNVNQITKNNNSRLYNLEDKKRLNEYMKKLIQKVNEVIERIGNM